MDQALSSSRSAEMQKNSTKNQMWTGVLEITLVEGQDLPQYGQGDNYVRFRLGDQKYKSKVGPRFFFFPYFSHAPFPSRSRFFTLQVFYYVVLPPLLSLSRCLSGAHLHLGSLGHGRGSSLDWARLPLTSLCAAGAGLHCLHLHTQHALFIYLYLLASLPTVLRRTCLVLSRHFFANLSAFFSAGCLLDKADSNWKLSVFYSPRVATEVYTHT